MSYKGFDYFSAEIVAEIEKSSLVKSVYDYAEANPTTYPAVIVTSSSLDGQFADNARTSDTFGFSILCMANRLNIESTVESTMRQLVDDIITRLNDNPTINDNASTFGKPLSIRWGYATAPDPDMRLASITYQVKVVQ